MFRADAIVVQSEGTYLVTMELPGARAAQVPFDIEQPDHLDLIVLHPPSIITDTVGPDTNPFRVLYRAVGAFHRAARSPLPHETCGGRSPARLRDLRIDHGSGYAGTVELPGGEVVTVTFVVREAVAVPESLRPFAGPEGAGIAQVVEAVAAFHRATQAQS